MKYAENFCKAGIIAKMCEAYFGMFVNTKESKQISENDFDHAS